MKRLVTDNPQSNVETMLNYAYAEDNEVKLRYGEHEDQRLSAYIAHRAKVLCDCEMTQDDIMEGACFECVHYCALGILNTVAIQAAELRGRLKAIEEILGDDYDLDRIREMVDADREGRAVILPLRPSVGTRNADIHIIDGGEIISDSVCEYSIGETSAGTIDTFVVTHCGASDMLSNMGKTLFLTREEAEAALKGCDGNES